MAIEIERKFLVKSQQYRESQSTVTITQAYLVTDPEKVIRIRILGDKSILAIKSKRRGLIRSEYEFEIDPVSAREIIDQLCIRPFIEKVRYLLEFKGFTWEVDEFHGENEGLVVAEIELPSEDTFFETPEWIGDEVTDDPRYLNSNLVKLPYTKW
jgi:adenylate cyclase